MIRTMVGDWGSRETRLLEAVGAPALLTSWLMLSMQVDSGVPIAATWRVWAVVLAITFIVGVAWLVTLRNGARAGVAATATILLLSSRDLARLGLAITLILAVMALTAMVGRIWHRPASARAVLRASGAVIGAMIVVTIVQGLLNGTIMAAAADLIPRGQTARPASPEAVGPDVYVMLLDGYPRADALERITGDDNSEFIDELERRGFFVAPGSTSSYMYTDLSLIPLLHGRHLVDIPALDPILAGESRPRVSRDVLNEAPLLRRLEQAGYTTYANGQAWDEPSLSRVDVFLPGSGLNEFERLLLTHSLPGVVLTLVDPGLDQTLMEPWVDDAFEAFTTMARAEATGPKFGLVHVPSPHFPIVFREDGSRADATFGREHPDQVDAPVEEIARAYQGQISHLNNRISAALDSASLDDDAIVVLLSDHGPEFGLSWADGASSDLRTRFSTFLAARSMDDTIALDSSVNETLIQLVNHLTDAAIPHLEPRYFVSDGLAKWSTLREIPDPFLGARAEIAIRHDR
jgi:hypothetical protein